MTPGGRLAAIIELLQAVYDTERPADATLSAYFRQRRYIGAKDRAFIAGKTYATLRHHARLGWWILREEGTVTPRTRALANAILSDGQSAAIIQEMFSGKFGPIPLSIYETDLVRRLDGHTLDHPDMPEGVRLEVPEWAEASLKATLGADYAREMKALIPPADIDLRVNTLKAERAACVEQLNADGIVCRAAKFSPVGIRVEGRPSIMAHPLYKSGAIEIQDEGSQIVALLVAAEEGQAVLDYCAGAGGKTLALAAAMHNKGRIVAADVLGARLERAKDRCRTSRPARWTTMPKAG
jgi:16S rRNA (cytosine967-C5)-methyltransferase